jgi:tetratricopeptide (TPR) repeat protein
MARKDYVHSLEDYNQCIKVDNNFFDACNNKGVALDNLRRYKEAIKCYDKVLDIKPDYAKA